MTKVENGKVYGWFNFVNNKLELHIPLELEGVDGYNGTDFSVFYLDPDMISIKNDQGLIMAKLKGGEYPVERTQKDFLVVIELE